MSSILLSEDLRNASRKLAEGIMQTSVYKQFQLTHAAVLGNEVASSIMDALRDEQERLLEISLERDIEDGLRYDAFLADNALPYFTREEGNEILSSAVKLVNNKGIIQALGLNKNMFVKIPLGNKIKAILNKKIKQQYNMLMDEKQKKIGKEYQHGYRHIYIKNNQGVIIQVISEGAIEMFSWIRTYLSKLNLDYAMKLMKMVTIGTGLSSWGKYVQTNTIESYQDLLKLLANTNYTVVDHPGDDADWQDMVLSTFTVLVE